MVGRYKKRVFLVSDLCPFDILTGEIAVEVTGVVGVSPALWYFRYIASIFLTLHKRLWSDIYFEIVGPTAFLSVRTDGFREVWVSRSYRYQQEGYLQQSLHQLGKTENFPKSGLCLFIYYITSGLIIIF